MFHPILNSNLFRCMCVFVCVSTCMHVHILSRGHHLEGRNHGFYSSFYYGHCFANVICNILTLSDWMTDDCWFRLHISQWRKKEIKNCWARPLIKCIVSFTGFDRGVQSPLPIPFIWCVCGVLYGTLTWLRSCRWFSLALPRLSLCKTWKSIRGQES